MNFTSKCCKRFSRFSRFPKNEILANEWINAIERNTGLKKGKRGSICIEHFKQSDFTGRKSRHELKFGSVPSVFIRNHVHTTKRTISRIAIRAEEPPARSLNQFRGSENSEHFHYTIEDDESVRSVAEKYTFCRGCESKDEEIERYRTRINRMQKQLVKLRRKVFGFSTSEKKLKAKLLELKKKNESNAAAREMLEVMGNISLCIDTMPFIAVMYIP